MRCVARTRAGVRCRRQAGPDGRCRQHGWQVRRHVLLWRLDRIWLALAELRGEHPAGLDGCYPALVEEEEVLPLRVELLSVIFALVRLQVEDPAPAQVLDAVEEPGWLLVAEIQGGYSTPVSEWWRTA